MTDAHLQTLEYLSPEKIYGFNKQAELLHTTIDDLQISEVLSPREQDDLDPNLQIYQLKIVALVRDLQALEALQWKVFDVVEELDRIWTYVAGYPLSTVSYGPSLRIIEEPVQEYGWTSNAAQLKSELESRERLHGTLRLINRSWMWLDEPPLHQALSTASAYNSLEAPFRELISLHHQAYRARDVPTTLFFLSKCLELVSENLKGRNAKHKGQSLPEEVKENLINSFEWLSTIANRRREARHIVDKKITAPEELHASITAREYRDFVEDANLVVRAFAGQKLGLEPIVLKSGKSTTQQGAART